MNHRPYILLYPAAVLAVAALVHAAGNRRLRKAQISELLRQFESLNHRLEDLENYLQPLRDYAKNRILSL